MSAVEVPAAVEELIGRSRRLGADPRNTNHGGGNTSVKAIARDPVTGADVEVMWVKGSGGDLATLSVDGLAALGLERVRALERACPGPEHDDGVHDLLGHCAFGPPGAAPSIDTSMHALLPAAHVDHLHPDAVIAFAAARDGEALTRACYGDDVAWVPWRRPGFTLALDVRRLAVERPGLQGVVLGGHGLTAWGDTSAECERRSVALIRRAEAFVAEHGRPDPLGPARPGYEALPPAERRRRAAALAPLVRGLASTDGPVVGHWWDSDDVLDFVASAAAPRVVPRGTSCPDHLIRTKVRPLLLDAPAGAPLAEQEARLRELHARYRAAYRAYYERHAGAGSPPLRGADPAIVLLPGLGMLSFGPDARGARLAGACYRNAIAAIRGAEAVSAYQPIPEPEQFGVEYWELEERKLRRRPPSGPLAGKVALVTGAGSGIGRAIARAYADAGAAVAAVDVDGDAARSTADDLGGADAAAAARADVSEEGEVRAAVEAAVLAFGGVDIAVSSAGLALSRALADTTAADWDRQHDVMAKGAFLVAREAATVMVAQGTGGDLVYVVSKNAVAAGPDNVAYASAKASQAHQVRLLAAELGRHGIRVNGVNPDAVVRGSGIFAGGWGAERARVHGVAESELGAFYAGRTLLGLEVLPEHVARAALALVDGSLSRTTGLLVPVDGGVAAAFLR